MNDQLPTPEHFPAMETYLDEALEYHQLTWQEAEMVQAGDVVKITKQTGETMIFACCNHVSGAVGANGRLAIFMPDGALQETYEDAYITLAHPAPALRSANVRFVEIELSHHDKRVRFQPVITDIEKTHIPALAAVVRYDAWKREATAALTGPTARAVLDRAAQHLEEKARIEQDQTRYAVAALVLRELQG